jgi:transcriptional regulator with XRE-family HTH domain
MPLPGSPTVRRRLLAAELRRLRADSGKTAEDVGRRLGWSKAKVSRYELAQGGLKPADIEKLMELYGVHGSQREQLLSLAEDATGKGWWEAYSDVLWEGHTAFIGLEAEASSILEWQINAVPGLLQTEQYAWEVLSGAQAYLATPPRAMQRQLETRLTRQQLLTRANPVEYEAVLDESILYRRRGDQSVMQAQLLRLTDMSELPNVTIRILPFKVNHALSVDSFAILRFDNADEGALPDVVSVEHLRGEFHVEGDKEAHEFRLAFRHLADASLDPAQSRELVLAAAGRAWSLG